MRLLLLLKLSHYVHTNSAVKFSMHCLYCFAVTWITQRPVSETFDGVNVSIFHVNLITILLVVNVIVAVHLSVILLCLNTNSVESYSIDSLFLLQCYY